ncbi:septal ring lytic transglycosylase RlpA family protein [Herbaspirillum huttiense F1]|jgi:rare lipoprotein A|uniref:septal ring lytic transglycosylase RlpA family protein n=1 Tax=Herbaspirillum TaxID=963 RepID=UPI0010CF54F3|nr:MULTISPECIES: septal ring lytic transglycosylase RlpA family protein [Herbaspirillum]MBP1317156.1 rare lipoprotein A [Herbaspirillum sp. 1130]MDR6741617.1 rare lipoprotein A [Herbaspirillum sp. 1173]MDT0356980.1 septal ring lytic transglycosylase RlpA family protein [Herbaspirillum huttiense F1]
METPTLDHHHPRASLGRALRWGTLLLPLLLAACGTSQQAPRQTAQAPATPTKSASTRPSNVPALPAAGSGRGGYYKDDGPGDHIPDGLLDVADAEPQVEPVSKAASRPYAVFGKTYVPITDNNQPFIQRGVGSWYGKKFHGQKTSSGELYDMYKMTAAHPTLPIPSYARVTNLKTGKQVIVRINDRGPFHSSRIIDLSYTAALKLGYLGTGSSELEVERILPEEAQRMADARRNGGGTTLAAADPINRAADTGAGGQGVSTGPVEINTVSAQSLPPQPTVAAVQPINASTSSAAGGAGMAGGGGIINAVASGSAPSPAMPQAVPLTAGYYLQFGAYSQEANALVARDKLLPSLSGIVDSMQAVQVNGLYRLYAGPYPTRPAAQNAAMLVRQRSAGTPFIVER